MREASQAERERLVSYTIDALSSLRQHLVRSFAGGPQPGMLVNGVDVVPMLVQASVRSSNQLAHGSHGSRSSHGSHGRHAKAAGVSSTHGGSHAFSQERVVRTGSQVQGDGGGGSSTTGGGRARVEMRSSVSLPAIPSPSGLPPHHQHAHHHPVLPPHPTKAQPTASSEMRSSRLKQIDVEQLVALRARQVQMAASLGEGELGAGLGALGRTLPDPGPESPELREAISRAKASGDPLHSVFNNRLGPL